MTGNSRQKFTWITFSESIFSINSDRKTQVDCTETRCSDASKPAPSLGRTTPAARLVHGTHRLPPFTLEEGRTSAYMPVNHAPALPDTLLGRKCSEGKAQSVLLGDDREETGHGGPGLGAREGTRERIWACQSSPDWRSAPTSSLLFPGEGQRNPSNLKPKFCKTTCLMQDASLTATARITTGLDRRHLEI